MQKCAFKSASFTPNTRRDSCFYMQIYIIFNYVLVGMVFWILFIFQHAPSWPNTPMTTPYTAFQPPPDNSTNPWPFTAPSYWKLRKSIFFTLDPQIQGAGAKKIQYLGASKICLFITEAIWFSDLNSRNSNAVLKNLTGKGGKHQIVDGVCQLFLSEFCRSGIEVLQEFC